MEGLGEVGVVGQAVSDDVNGVSLAARKDNTFGFFVVFLEFLVDFFRTIRSLQLACVALRCVALHCTAQHKFAPNRERAAMKQICPW